MASTPFEVCFTFEISANQDKVRGKNKPVYFWVNCVNITFFLNGLLRLKIVIVKGVKC